MSLCCFFFFQAEDGIRDWSVTGVQTCALPISPRRASSGATSPGPPTIRACGSITCASGCGSVEIGRASCRKECRSRWSPDHQKKKKQNRENTSARTTEKRAQTQQDEREMTATY